MRRQVNQSRLEKRKSRVSIKKAIVFIQEATGVGRAAKRSQDRISKNPYYGYCRHIKPRVHKGAFGKAKYMKVTEVTAWKSI